MRDKSAMYRLTQVAAEQLGVISRDDVREARLSKDQLGGLLSEGVIEQAARNVYRFAGSTRSWEQSVLIAVKDGGPECLASHRTAGGLPHFHGFITGAIEA